MEVPHPFQKGLWTSIEVPPTCCCLAVLGEKLVLWKSGAKVAWCRRIACSEDWKTGFYMFMLYAWWLVGFNTKNTGIIGKHVAPNQLKIHHIRWNTQHRVQVWVSCLSKSVFNTLNKILTLWHGEFHHDWWCDTAHLVLFISKHYPILLWMPPF